MQDIYNFFAIASFILSCITCIVGGLSRSVRIDFDILDYRTDARSCKVYARIVNRSLLPLSIYSVSIIDHDHEYFCHFKPKPVRKDNELMFYTAEFPINLSAYQGAQHYIEYRNFPNSEPTQLVEGKTLAFRIYTNRTAITRHVTLGKESHYLHIRK